MCLEMLTFSLSSQSKLERRLASLPGDMNKTPTTNYRNWGCFTPLKMQPATPATSSQLGEAILQISTGAHGEECTFKPG